MYDWSPRLKRRRQISHRENLMPIAVFISASYDFWIFCLVGTIRTWIWGPWYHGIWCQNLGMQIGWRLFLRLWPLMLSGYSEETWRVPFMRVLKCTKEVLGTSNVVYLLNILRGLEGKQPSLLGNFQRSHQHGGEEMSSANQSYLSGWMW